MYMLVFFIFEVLKWFGVGEKKRFFFLWQFDLIVVKSSRNECIVLYIQEIELKEKELFGV